MSTQPPQRFLVVAADVQYARWLRHRIEASWEDTQVDVTDLAGFDPALPLDAELRLLVLVLSFATPVTDDEDGVPAVSPGLAFLRALSAAPPYLPWLVIAEDGNELSAIASLRNGATDYLPRRLLNPARLEAGIRYCLDHAPRRADADVDADVDGNANTGADTDAPVAAAAAESAAPAVSTAAPEAEASSASSLHPADLLAVPRDLFPRYTLLSKIGESARATVYLAASAALGHNVALKVSRVVDGEDAQFAQEFAAIGALDDPAVVQIHDYGIYEGREYIAMEYFPCGDLKARLLNPISGSQSLAYLRRIASALTVVHDAGIVHRDLKPPNIMLREDGSVVLIDFGLAHQIDMTRSTAAGVLRGSPYYMSPEQAQGAELDQRSDLYSLGVIFYEMLVGSKPYRGATAVEVLTQHVQSPVPELPDDVAEFQPLLDGLMAKSRDDRFPSARALLEQLSVAA